MRLRRIWYVYAVVAVVLIPVGLSVFVFYALYDHGNVKNRELIYFQLAVSEFNELEIVFEPILLLLPSNRKSTYEFMITYESLEDVYLEDGYVATCKIICEKSNELEHVLKSDLSNDSLLSGRFGSRESIRDTVLNSYPGYPWPLTYMDILPTTPEIYSFKPTVEVGKRPKPYWLYVKLESDNRNFIDAKWGFIVARKYFTK